MFRDLFILIEILLSEREDGFDVKIINKTINYKMLKIQKLIGIWIDESKEERKKRNEEETVPDIRCG